MQADHLAADDPVLDSGGSGDRGDVAHRDEPGILGPRCRVQVQLGHNTEPDATIQVRTPPPPRPRPAGLRERS